MHSIVEGITFDLSVYAKLQSLCAVQGHIGPVIAMDFDPTSTLLATGWLVFASLFTEVSTLLLQSSTLDAAVCVALLML